MFSSKKISELLIIIIALCSFVLSAKELYKDNFSTGYEEGFVVRQNSWRGSNIRIPPIVVHSQNDGSYLNCYQGDHMAKKTLNNLSSLNSDAIYIEVCLFVPDSSCAFQFGLGEINDDNLPNTFGIDYKKAIYVRGEKYTGKVIPTQFPKGKEFSLAGQKIILRSVWNLKTKELAMFVKKFSDKYFVRLEFAGKLKTDMETVSDPKTWNDFTIRMGGRSDVKLYSVEIGEISKSLSDNLFK